MLVLLNIHPIKYSLCAPYAHCLSPIKVSAYEIKSVLFVAVTALILLSFLHVGMTTTRRARTHTAYV